MKVDNMLKIYFTDRHDKLRSKIVNTDREVYNILSKNTLQYYTDLNDNRLTFDVASKIMARLPIC